MYSEMDTMVVWFRPHGRVKGENKLVPQLQSIDTKNGVVYFKPFPRGLQIEVYKYTRHKSGQNIKKVDDIFLGDRIGKRFVPQMTVSKKTNAWKIPEVYIRNCRNYFRFAFRNPFTGERQDLTSYCIKTFNAQERMVMGAIFLLIG